MPIIPLSEIDDNKPLILVTNDDGHLAPGLQALVEGVRELGHVVVVAPDGPRSGMSCAISPGRPLSLRHIKSEPGLHFFTFSGTPADCVKIAIDRVLPRPPRLVVSGVNLGPNLSVSVHYSGTLGAVIDACVRGLPAVAFSLCTFDPSASFGVSTIAAEIVARKILGRKLPVGVFVNVNIPAHPEGAEGIRTCRAAWGRWVEEWTDGPEPGTYVLGGTFQNLEPEATDTDCWAVDHRLVAVTPLSIDLTYYSLIPEYNENRR